MSVFGGSKVQIGGPTGAFIIIIYGIPTGRGPPATKPKPPICWIPQAVPTATLRFFPPNPCPVPKPSKTSLGSEALPLLRTESSLWDAPVFRRAYWLRQTLRLQPLRGLRGAGGASLPPCCAPNHPFGMLRCSGRFFFRKEHTVLFSPKHSTFSRFAASLLRTDL